MIILKLKYPVKDKDAAVYLQAAKILFNSTREGFEVTWSDTQTLEIRQSETYVKIARDFNYQKGE